MDRFSLPKPGTQHAVGASASTYDAAFVAQPVLPPLSARPTPEQVSITMSPIASIPTNHTTMHSRTDAVGIATTTGRSDVDTDAVQLRDLELQIADAIYSVSGIRLSTVHVFSTGNYTRGCHWFPRLLA